MRGSVDADFHILSSPVPKKKKKKLHRNLTVLVNENCCLGQFLSPDIQDLSDLPQSH